MGALNAVALSVLPIFGKDNRTDEVMRHMSVLST